MDTVVSFVIASAPRVRTDIDTISVTITGITGELGSFESHQAAGGFSGDSRLDSDGPTLSFLTPDLLERSWRSLEPSTGLKMPWETGVWSTNFGKKQFGFHDAPGIQWTRLIPPPLQQVEGSQRPAEIRKTVHVADHWRQVVANTEAVAWKEDQEAKMEVSLKRWFDIISQFPDVHETVKQLHLVAGLPEQLRMLRDILAGKALSTLNKRANAMITYIEKLRQARIAVPGDEASLYNYFCELREAGVPLSGLRALVESIRFTGFIFGIDGLRQKLLSKRCLGASRRTGETVTKQSDPFTVQQLACLHKVVHDDAALFWDRLVCGASLVATCTKSRWVDLQHTVEIVLDPNELSPVFIELKIKEFKTRKANAWRVGTMAAVGPALPVVQGNWVKAWWALRMQLNAPVNAGFPLMPAPDMDGEPTIGQLTTTEFRKWIRMILNRDELLTPDAKVSSHSCKATMLNYLVKFGASIPDREILGGHTGWMKSVLTYSRDSLAALLKVLDSMLEEIQCGRFDPNASRSGMMLTNVKQETVVIEYDFGFDLVANDQTALDEEAGAEPGSRSDTSSDSEEEQVVDTHAARMVCALKPPDGTQLLQHPKSRMSHLIQDGYERCLMCDRKVEMANGNLYKPPASLRWDTPCCSHCWLPANTPLTSRLS